MPKTLLAVDDSATMRKVLEITFSGEDFKVVLAENGQAASRVSESPSAIVIDTVLGAEDGYEVARELRKKNPRAAIVLLASRYNPYDQNRGRDAGADDFADKPFDTQQLIDKVKKAIATRESSPQTAAPAAAAPQPAAPAAAPAAAAAPQAAAARPVPQVAPGVSKATQPSLGGEVRKNATLIFGDQVPNAPGAATAPASAPARAPAAPPAAAPPARAAAEPAASPAPPPVAAAPAAPPPAPPAPVAPPPVAAAPVAAPAAASPAVAAAVNGHLAPKLEGLGLSAGQADAIMALSREIVEKVVWEIVPQLAESIIKEEIARLTK